MFSVLKKKNENKNKKTGNRNVTNALQTTNFFDLCGATATGGDAAASMRYFLDDNYQKYASSKNTVREYRRKEKVLR